MLIHYWWQAGEALRVQRTNSLGRRARGPAWPPEVGDAEPLPAGCDAGDLVEVLEFLEVSHPRLHSLKYSSPPLLSFHHCVGSLHDLQDRAYTWGATQDQFTWLTALS